MKTYQTPKAESKCQGTRLVRFKQRITDFSASALSCSNERLLIGTVVIDVLNLTRSFAICNKGQIFDFAVQYEVSETVQFQKGLLKLQVVRSIL